MYYSLRIVHSDDNKNTTISEILGVSSNYPEVGWGLEIVEDDNDLQTNAIEYFLKILDNKFQLLENIGIQREDISIWLLYEYNDQCNIEFIPSVLRSIGDFGLSLCVSCWQKG